MSTKKKTKASLLFEAIAKKEKLPFVEEYKFHPTRKWRFDYALIEEKIAIEIEGGVFLYGRHNRPTGFLKDMEKYNTATVLGWRVLRFTPEQITNGTYLNYLFKILQSKK